ncbi:hypothetical protein JL722_13349 [Aureococcus anophagefferens]|nr:hypothetical protein JL722_13349 [Aureococcus anophagefferens]
MINNGSVLRIDSHRFRRAHVSADGTRHSTTSVQTVSRCARLRASYSARTAITILDDPTFRSQPAYLFAGAVLAAILNVHLFDRPRFDAFKKSTCYDAVAGRARLVEMATHSRESHLAVDTYMDVDEIKLNGSWVTNPATVITDEYIEWTAREILAYASFLDAPSIVFKPCGEIASDNLDRLIAAITRIQNEEM